MYDLPDERGRFGPYAELSMAGTLLGALAASRSV
jgi:hypothetical protein